MTPIDFRRHPIGAGPMTFALLLVTSAALSGACAPRVPEPRPVEPAAPPHAEAPAVAVEEPEPEPVAQVVSIPLDAEAAAWVENTLASLSLRERAAQLVMPWVRGGRLAPGSAEFQRLRRAIAEDAVGGLIVGRGAAAEYAAGLNAAQALAGVPLLVVSDLETGPGMRLTGGTNFPPAMAFGAAGSEALAREAGRVTAREARAVGIHMTLGPVLDINTSPRNPIINTRAFGDDPAGVSRLAAAWIAGAREGGLLTAGKHFPGHGSTELDSHIGLPAVPFDAARLAAVELAPFRAAVSQGMEGVLVGHIAATGLEGPGAPPASLSRRVVGGLLREELGFDGLVFTDALNMGAITRSYDVAEASILAVLAGADVLLQPPGERRVIDALVRAVESGRIPRERIDESARRMLAAKAAAGLHRGGAARAARAARAAGAAGVVGSAAHRNLVRQVAEASVTLARDGRSLVPLPPGARRVLHVVYADAGSRFDASTFNATLRAAGHVVEAARVDPRTTASAFAALRDRAAGFDVVVASALVTPREYTGSITAAGGFPAWVERLAAEGRPVVAISFGTPYLLDGFPSVPAYLLAWSGTAESQRAAARALAGQAPITGRLPVSLPPQHRAGAGVQRAGGP
jgi:beta-N-acetylhexosaminidase